MGKEETYGPLDPEAHITRIGPFNISDIPSQERLIPVEVQPTLQDLEDQLEKAQEDLALTPITDIERSFMLDQRIRELNTRINLLKSSQRPSE